MPPNSIAHVWTGGMNTMASYTSRGIQAIYSSCWPNAGAASERLWSDVSQTQDANAAWPRFHEHRCRMLSRGYQVQVPNAPDFCPDYWDPPSFF
uniref:Beta-N-acetylhexosaminidase n=1 Tax=Acrobeloides nanus TaxID=290746 RepID=A0A914E5V2_9BILA